MGSERLEGTGTEGISKAEGLQYLLVRQLRLRVVKGPDEGKVYESDRENVTIGSHSSCAFVLQDPTVSRFHTSIHVQKERIAIRDLGSRNGSRVDGVLIDSARLHEGARLVLGRSEIVVEFVGGEAKVPLSERQRFGLLVGRSAAMRTMFQVLESASPSDITILLQGETGVGKDLASLSIHGQSARREGPFVVVDCGAVPANLLESELFGHERGAFTGAEHVRIGAFERASGGTLFLDEVSELDVKLQPRLLRALENREIQRVGSNKRIGVDVRIVAATNRNLHKEVNARRFRSDLFFRLAVLHVNIPPLKDRLDDLPLLIEEILDQLELEDDSPWPARFRAATFLSRLACHDWPGNVRELRNYLERCIAVGDALEPGDAETPLALQGSFREARDRWEREYLEQLLHRHDGNVKEAAAASGMNRTHFYRMLARHGLRSP